MSDLAEIGHEQDRQSVTIRKTNKAATSGPLPHTENKGEDCVPDISDDQILTLALQFILFGAGK